MNKRDSLETQDEGFKQTDSFVLFSKASSNVRFNQKEGKATKKRKRVDGRIYERLNENERRCGTKRGLRQSV